MDDSKNSANMQSSFTPSQIDEVPQEIQPEEVAADIETPDEIRSSAPSIHEDVPVYEENHSKTLFIGGIILFFLVVFGLLIFFIVRSRTPASPQPVITQQPVVLTYWGLWDEKEVLEPVFQAFQNTHKNITVKYEKMNSLQYRDRLIARSKTGNGPDLFRFHNTWLPEITDVVTEIPQQVMTPSDFEQTFYPIHAKDLKIGTKYYGIPMMVDSMVLIYNENLLKQAGMVAAPSVWVGDQNDMRTAAANLTVRDSTNSIITAGLAVGTSSNVDHYGEIFGILLMLNGGDLKKLDQPVAAEALQLYRSFAEDNIWSDALPGSVQAFIEGKVAMIIAPSWELLTIKAKNPELPVKVAPIPKGLNNTSVSVATYWVEGVNRYSKHQLEAWQLLKFMSEKEQLVRIFQEQSKVRPFGWIYSRRDMADLLKDNEYVAPVIRQAAANELVSLPLVDKTYDNGLNDEMLQYIKNAMNDSAKGVAYGAALSTAKQGVDQILRKYKIE